MASQTSIVAKQVRLMEWAEQIRDCQNRPREMDVAAWCAQHGITKANYYYRLKRVRKACLDQLADTGDSAFIEVPGPRRKSPEDVTLLSNPGCSTAAPVACIRNAGGLSAEIFPDISPEMLRCLVEAFGHAE